MKNLVNPRALLFFLSTSLFACDNHHEESKFTKQFPAHESNNISPDTQLKLFFNETPILGDSGKIRIYEASTGNLVDSLDLSIPSGPTKRNQVKAPYTPVPYEYLSENITNTNTKPGTPSGAALPTPDNYQLTIIGGFSDGFHFYPIIIRDSMATIYPHHNLLEYDKTYYVQIDPGVLTLPDSTTFSIDGNNWQFTTKKSAPSLDKKKLIVSADGTGDFNTVQGAIDFIPDNNPDEKVIFIQNGTYEELVYFRNKQNVTFLGESKDGVKVCYKNDEVFNPHPVNISTNEWVGTFPSRRAAFTADNSTNINLVNMTIMSLIGKPAQAEGLLLMGEKNMIYNVGIIGSGDALQINGSVYLEQVSVTGFGDNILGRGPAFFKNCELRSTYGPHMWIRNTDENHGNVFVNCVFRSIGDVETVIARCPVSNDRAWPYSEAILINCAMDGIKPEGWGTISEETKNIRYWEFQSINLEDSSYVDMSQRHEVVKELTLEEDADIINQYSNPEYVLGGWNPGIEAIKMLGSKQ